MTNKSRLTPPSTTPLERALETATDKLRAPDVHTLWDAYACPERLLPWLAWAVGVEVWDDAWPVAVRRSAIAAAMKIARHRGSVWAVKEALIAAGYAGAEIEEGLPPLRHNGAQLRDGLETYGSGNRWAMFKLIAELGETKGVGGAELRQLIALIDNAKPARSQLTEIEYRSNISDVATPEEQSATIAQPQFNDVRPAGRRRDGSLSRDNAIQLPPAPLLRNSQWQRNAEAARTGLSPYYTWEVTGETRDNRWESAAVNVDIHKPERVEVADPRRRGHATRDGAFLHGGPLPAAFDRAQVTIEPRLDDTATPDELANANLNHRLSEVRPAGRRRDGSLSRDNAIQLPPAPLLRNGQWQRNAEAARTGLSPYYTWEVTGETRENRWESAAVNVDIHKPERVAVVDPRRSGHATRDGAFLHGGPLPAAFDRAQVAIEPRLDDTATPDELATANLNHRLSEVRPAGRRRDGSLSRDNAIQLPPAPLLRNGQWQRNAEAARTGVSPYFGWQITGETRENRWEDNTLAVAQQIADAPSAPPIERRGAARRNGAPRRGAPNPAALDAVALTVSRRQRRNTRLFRNGSASRVPHYHQHLTL